MKNILQLNNLEARKYLLKEESYFNFDLPKYFSFKEIIKSVSTQLKGHKYSEFLATFKDANNNENIELVNQKASAGYRAGYADPEYIRVLPTFQMPFLSREKKYRTRKRITFFTVPMK